MNEYLRQYGLAALTSFLATFGGCLGAGCTMTLTGGGEMSIGMRNDNFLVLRHTVDGDKVDKGAESEFKAPALVDWVTGGDKPETEEVK